MPNEYPEFTFLVGHNCIDAYQCQDYPAYPASVEFLPEWNTNEQEEARELVEGVLEDNTLHGVAILDQDTVKPIDEWFAERLFAGHTDTLALAFGPDLDELKRWGKIWAANEAGNLYTLTNRDTGQTALWGIIPEFPTIENMADVAHQYGLRAPKSEIFGN